MSDGAPSEDSPVARILRRRIALEGPISVAAFMAEALGDPKHGYYATRDPFGVAGDFTTAPEISQMFGELVGLWCAQVWLDMGAPPQVALVELGPGRGTLMADALRAARAAPGFREALSIHLVETSPTLRERQAATLAEIAPSRGPVWHDAVADLPDDQPLLVIANEFFDALPIRQFVRAPGGWRERLVAVDEDGRFVFVAAPGATPATALVPEALRCAPVGAIYEICPAGIGVAAALGARLAAQGGAALVVDYGYAGPALGDTLQALRSHAYAPVLERPGDADLTAHVDFSALANAAQGAGGRVFGPAEQGAFLFALGIAQRAEHLKRRATPDQAQAVDAALTRLTAPEAMGRLFKVLGLAGPGGFGLPALEARRC